MGVASLIIGIVCLLGSFIPFFNYFLIVPVIVGLVLGIVELVKKSKIEGSKKGQEIAGVVLNSVAISIIILWTYVGIFLFSTLTSSGIIQEMIQNEYVYTDDFNDSSYNDSFYEDNYKSSNCNYKCFYNYTS